MAKKAPNYKHVLPHSDGWAVKSAGAERNIKVFSTKSAAVRFAVKLAKEHKSELFIHSKTGRISERNTYGKDHFPPKG